VLNGRRPRRGNGAASAPLSTGRKALLLCCGTMSATAAQDPRLAIGRSPDALTLGERTALAGQFVALEVYTPKDLPLRRIEAIGADAAACARQLTARGLDPLKFEFVRLLPPF
jgi:hypothetical protein